MLTNLKSSKVVFRASLLALMLGQLAGLAVAEDLVLPGVMQAPAAKERKMAPPPIPVKRIAERKANLVSKNIKPIVKSVEGTVMVSDREYNHFILPEPFQTVIFPPGTPVKGNPIPLADNRGFLLQMKKGTTGVYQMIVQMKDGRVKMIRLNVANVPGVTHRVDGALDKLPSSAEMTYRPETPHAPVIKVFKQFTMGSEHIPDSFTEVEKPRAVHFETFTAKPAGAWTDGYRRMLVFQLDAVKGSETVIAPPQFYRRGVVAIEIDGGDVVSDKHSPTLYILTDESLWSEG